MSAHDGYDYGLSTAKVGSDVVIVTFRHGPDNHYRLTKAVAVGKRKVKMEDGTEWNMRGDRWGQERDFWARYPTACVVTDMEVVRASIAGSNARFELASLRSKVGDLRAASVALTADQCRRILAIVAEEPPK